MLFFLALNALWTLVQFDPVSINLHCAAATQVYGSFSFLNLLYEREMDNIDSTSFKELSQLLSTEIERELYSFTLPGRFEATISGISNR